MTSFTIPKEIQPNNHERRALAERARADAMLGKSFAPALTERTEPSFFSSLEARNDVEAGLNWVLSFIGPTTVVAIKPDGPATAAYLEELTLIKVASWAKSKNGAGANLYFQVNQPQPGLAKKASRSEIIAIRAAAWLDLDAKDGRTMAQALAAIEALPIPPPSVIIASGGGYQPIWLLDRPVPTSLEIVRELGALGKQLEQRTGSDAVSNIDRILRLPFTMNYPNAKKLAGGRQVTIAGLLHRRRVG